MQMISRLTGGFGLSQLSHIDDLLRHHSVAQPSKPAVIFGDSQLSYSRLETLVEAGAVTLSSRLGNSRQKVVGLLMPNSLDYVVAYLSIVRSGHIALPIDVIYKPLELEAIAGQMKPELILTDLNGKKRLEALSFPVLTADQLAAPSSGETKFLRLPADRQIASLLFTSGTTGQPKAAPYTHANHLWNIKVCSQVWDWTAADSLLISLRLSHWYGLVMGLSGALYHGNTLYLQDKFDAVSTLEELASGRISHFTHTPYAYAKMLERPGEFDISAVRLLISGSAPLPPSIWDGFKKRFGKEIIECYGSSETGRIVANTVDDRQPGSAGLVLPEVDLKINPHGEVLVKSPGVFPGYWKNASATKAAMGPGGWWRTGDLGELNGQRLYLRGRRHETIRRYGYMISPRDIEWAMHQCTEVDEIHVLGRSVPNSPDDELIYFVVPKGRQTQIHDFYQANLPSVWRPDEVIFLDQLPRTHNGKVSIATLKAMLK